MLTNVDKSTLEILKHGEVLLRVLRQEQYKVRSLSQQVFELYMAKNKYLDDLPIEEVRKYLDDAYKYIMDNKKNILKDIDDKKEIREENEKALKKAIEDFQKINKK